MLLELDRIRIDGNTQSRVELDHHTVEEYTEAMLAGAEFPPVVVFFDGVDHWLADGFHRYFGIRMTDFACIDADVRNGSMLDAQLYSFGVNTNHGLRRTNADKRKAVEGALQHPVSSKWSDNQIAKHCGVSHPTVGAVRGSLVNFTSEKPTERAYTTKHGTEAVMKTANIGKKPASAKAAPALPVETPAVQDAVEAARKAAGPSLAELSQAELVQAKAAVDRTLAQDIPEYDGPSDEEIRAAQMQEAADQAAFNALLLADDKLAAAYAEVKRLNGINSVLESRLQGLMNEKNEAIKLCKSLQRQVDRLKKGAA